MSDKPRVWVDVRKGVRKTSYLLRWIDYGTGRYRCRTVGTDRKLAEREAARLEDQLREGTYREVKRIGWHAFVDDHVSKIPGLRTREDARLILADFGKAVAPCGPHVVTYSMVERYVAILRERGNAPATVNKALRYLRSALNRAVKRAYAGSNPISGSDLFLPVDDSVLRIASVTEESVLLEAAGELYGAPMIAFIVTALGTGGRLSELTALTWEHADVDDHEPSVRFVRTKSHKVRKVPISRAVADVLLKLKPATLQDGGPFIQYASRSNLNKRWHAVVKAAAVPPITVHDLRRTYITRMLAAGAPLTTVQRLAGHANVQTTVRYYTEVNDSDLRSAVRKLEATQAG